MPKVTLSTYSLFLEKNYREAMQFSVEHGFGGIEIWSHVSDFWPGAVSAGEIDATKAIVRDNHISLAMHFCAANNLADINQGHLRKSMEQLKETIRLCRKIGAEILVVHLIIYALSLRLLCMGPAFRPLEPRSILGKQLPLKYAGQQVI